MFYYFGYGSNMNPVSLRAKGVEPVSAQPAVLDGWRLTFNIPDFFPIEGGTGNIERAEGAQVHGVLYGCQEENLKDLDELEALGVAYARTQVDVRTYAGEECRAYVYVGIPSKLAEGYQPSQRYRSLLVQGAEQAGLNGGYIEFLRAIEVQPPVINPPFRFPDAPAALFTENELRRMPLHTALAGAVFDMSHARKEHAYLQRFLQGKDVSLFFLKRLDTSAGNESLADLQSRNLREEQKRYLNNYLHEFAREYRYVGRMDYSAHWGPEPFASRGLPGPMAGKTQESPSLRVLRTAERTNKELGHENLGFLSEQYGFMPSRDPRQSMPQAFLAWDEVASRLPELYRTLQLRKTLDQMPMLMATEEHLSDSYLLRGAALMSMLSHAYWYVETEPPDGLPVTLSKPWQQIRERLGRADPVLTYMDLIVYNWRMLDPTVAEPRRLDNMRLLIPTVDNKEERIFYLTQTEILARCSPIIGAVAHAQDAVLKDTPEKLHEALETILRALRKIVRESLLNINPNPHGQHFVDPVIWAKTVAPFAVPFVKNVQGPSGTSSPIFNLMDIFLGRKRYQTFLGKEIKDLRRVYPRFWQEFLSAVDEVSVSEYVERIDNSDLSGLLKEVVETYVGENGFLGRHRMKVYGYLELAFKVGRSVTIGGFSGLFQDRTWDQVDSELEYSRVERLESFPKGCHFAKLKSVGPTHRDAPDGTLHVVLDVSECGVRYEPGDRCAILPENGDEIVARTLESLGASGDEVLELTEEWQEHVNLRWGYAGKKELSLKTILRFAKLRPVTPRIAEALHAITQNDTLKDAILSQTTTRWEFWDLLRLLTQEGFKQDSLLQSPIGSSTHLCRVLPPENFRMYSISSDYQVAQGKHAQEIHLTVGRIRYPSEETTYAPSSTRLGTASDFLARSQGRDEPISFYLEHPPRFGLPTAPNTPIVLLAGGTGISPFRAFLRERMAQQSTGHTFLFLGIRNRKYFYYQEELAKLAAHMGVQVHVAFSRDNVRVALHPDPQDPRFEFLEGPPQHIQELLTEDNVARKLWTLLRGREDGGRGAYFYICGRSRFSKSVHDAFQQILIRFAEGTPSERAQYANKVIAQLSGEGRYMEEIFTDARSWDSESPEIDISEIVTKNSADSGYWLVVDDRVFDLTSFLATHPGGVAVLRGYAGMDGTFGYMRAHKNQSEVDAIREMYEIGKVRRPHFGDVSGVVLREGTEQTVSLAAFHRAWTALTYLVVEMQNALENDQSLQFKETTRGEESAGRTPYKLQRAIETQERFLHNYLDTLTGRNVTDLWLMSTGLDPAGPPHDGGWMAQEMQRVKTTEAALYTESLSMALKDGLQSMIRTSPNGGTNNPEQVRQAADAVEDLQRVTNALERTKRDFTRLNVDEDLLKVQSLANALRQSVDRLLQSKGDPAGARLVTIRRAAEYLETASRNFLAQVKSLLREGLLLFEKHEDQCLNACGGELTRILAQIPGAIENYYEGVRQELLSEGWKAEPGKDRTAFPTSKGDEPMSNTMVGTPYWLMEDFPDDGYVMLRRSAKPIDTLEQLKQENAKVITQIHSPHDSQGIVVDMRQAPPRNDPEFEDAMAKLRAEIYSRYKKVAVLLSSAVGVLQVNRLGRSEHSETLATMSEAAAIKFAKGET